MTPDHCTFWLCVSVGQFSLLIVHSLSPAFCFCLKMLRLAQAPSRIMKSVLEKVEPRHRFFFFFFKFPSRLGTSGLKREESEWGFVQSRAGCELAVSLKMKSSLQGLGWFSLWVGKIPWRRKWQPTPAFLPGELHGQRSLAGYSPGES